MVPLPAPPSLTQVYRPRSRAPTDAGIEEVQAVTADTSRGGGSSSTAELVNEATTQLSTLIRDELALAKLELTEKGKRAGIGGGLFGAAAVLGWYALGLLLTLAVVLFDTAWPLWLAVLVVLVAVAVAAAGAALLGRQKLKSATPLLPLDAIAGVETDVRTVKNAAHQGRPA
jgi:uncharacterized membrane protein YqjE